MCRRYGKVIKLPKEKYAEYKKWHQNVWPEICETIRNCNVRNFSIYYKDGVMFQYYEYIGDNYEIDMGKWASDEKCIEWNQYMEDFLVPWEGEKAGVEWSQMEELFHNE